MASLIFQGPDAHSGQIMTPARCDRCGARANLEAELDNGVLTFCRHHGRQYFQALLTAGARLFEYPVS
ncbi:hypothetical protein [Kribbella sp. NPDC004536]|uniref:DUF7455 domain-containing protein n=1 Tax=Kribbella sp. NPDC004536 TaxID=3364106 RepID=UPI0036802C74